MSARVRQVSQRRLGEGGKGMERTGLIMKLTDKTVIVMTPSGEFVQVRRLANMEVGMEIPIPEIGTGAGRRRRKAFGWQRVGVAATAACFVVAAGAWFGISQMGDDTAFAYVAMDINPSIAFTIDKANKVMNVVGLNTDGKALVTQLKVNRKPLKEAINEAIDDAVSRQMLPNQDAILITAAPVDNGHTDISQVPSEVKADVQAALQGNTKAQALHPSVYTLQLSHSVWDAARKANISPGKLASYMIARQEGRPLTLNDLEGKTLNSVMASSQSATNVVAALESGNQQDIRAVLDSISNQAPTKQLVISSKSGAKTHGKQNQTHGQSNKPKQDGSPTQPASQSQGTSRSNESNSNTTGTQSSLHVKVENNSGITVNLAGQKFHIDVGQKSDDSSDSGHSQHADYSSQNKTAGRYHAPTDGLKMPRRGGSPLQGTNPGTLG